MAVDPTVAAWVGVLLGTILGTLWPYYNVLRANPETKFDRDYAVSAIIAALIAMPSSLVAYALVQAQVPAVLAGYVDSPWFIFVLGILVGAGADRWLNEKIVDKGGT